ncbi:MAG TPA: LAGLIDADG family homing endonuclease, partial [Trueperaceae bacterium]
EVRLTANHRLKRITRQTHDDQESEWVEVADLAVGDRLALANHRGVASWSGAGTFSEGWLLGSLVGDGAFVDGATPRACLAFGGEGKDETARLAREALERLYGPQAALRVTEQERKIRLMSVELAELARRFGIVHGNKTITDEVEQASFVFYQGFLCGLFDADGAVQAHQQGASVRLSRSNPDLLRGVQRMLARLGIIATICEERRPEGDRSLPAGKGGTRESFCQADHELVIAGDNLPVFREIVDFEDPAKRQRLAQVLDPSRCRPDRERFSDRIAAIEADGEEEVYDVAVERVHEFDANGVAAHNCGEIPLFPGEPCDLGAMNLAQYVHTGDTGTDGFDWEAFRADVGTAIRFLDNVLEVNRFALPDNRDMSMRLRRLGLGIMGLADALIRMGYRYDSEEGRQAAAAIISELREAATRTSQELAEERGAFPEFEASALGTPRRNVALLTVAPTGTTSMLMGVSSGIEPVFAPFVYRKIGDSYAALIHPLFRELLERHAPPAAYRQAGAWDWDKVVEAVQDNHGSVQGLDFIPDDVKKVLVCAHDIAPADHVRMQGVVQASFDDGGQQVANSISKTINLPNEAAVTDVYDAYSLAFQTGCKGITVYRDGSREFQVLSTKASKNPSRTTEPTPPAAAQAPAARPLDTKLPGEPLFDRPPRLTGFTDNVKLTLATGERRSFFITVNKQYDLPIEVFISSGKSGDESNADSEALGRMVSIALQYGVPAEAVVKTLRGIDGGMYGSYQGRMVASKADLIAVALETAGVENVLQQGTACPDCGAPLRFEEGCRKCESCGYSRCG